MIARHADGRALDSGDFAVALIDDFGLDAVPVGPLQIHPQQHRGPILRLGAARSGLNVEKRIVRVHLAGKHALEFQLFDLGGQTIDVRLDFFDCRGIRLGNGQFQEFRGVAQCALQTVEAADDLLELGPLLSQFLGAVPACPRFRVARVLALLPAALVFVVVIKDTSSKSRRAPRDL